MIAHIAPKFARPALVASGSAWPSTRRTAALAYRAACRHARRSTAKRRDAVHTPHGQVGGPGTTYGRHVGPCEALHTPLPSTDALDTLSTRRVASQRRDSTAKALAEPLLERCKHLLGAGGAVLGRCNALLQPSLGSIPPQNAAMSPISLTAITYFPDEFPISHNLLRNLQL